MILKAALLTVSGLSFCLEARVLSRDVLLDNYSRESVLLQVGRIAASALAVTLTLALL